jgi:lipoprotein NlpD
MLKQITFLVVVFTLAGCGTMSSAPIGEPRVPVRIEAPLPGAAVPAVAPSTDKFYVVKKGDTLYSIALNHGVTSRDLVAWNSLDNASRITIGQRLRVNAPAPAAPAGMPAPGSAEVQAITLGGSVVGRPLDGAVSPAPTFVPGETETLKRVPKGGKLPYSEANLALLKAQQGPATIPVAPMAEEKPAAPPAPAPAPAPAAPAAPGDIDWAWPATGKLLAGFSEGGDGKEANKGIDIAGKQGEPVQAAAAGKVVYAGSGLRGYGNLVIVRHNASFLSAYAHNSRILVKEGQTVVRGQKIAEMGNSDADQTKLHFEVRQQGKPVDPLKFLPPR